MNARLTILSPIHVWSGKELIVGIDLVKISDNKYCVVDFESIPPDIVLSINRALAQGHEIENVIAGYADKLPCRQQVEAHYKPQSRERIKSIADYLVPGSTLKGYIRTSIMYTLLESLSQERFRELMNSLDLENPKNVAQPLEGMLFRKPRLRRQGGFVDSFQQLLVSDPLEVRDVKLSIVRVEVVKVDSGKIIAYIPLIAVTKGELSYSVTIPDRVSLSKIAYKPNIERYLIDIVKKLSMFSEMDRDSLLGYIGKYSCTVIKEELRRLAKCKDKLEKCRTYHEWLEILYNEYCGSRTSEGCVLTRLGFAAGYHSKTILPLIARGSPEVYRQVKSVMSNLLRRVWDELTVKLVNLNGKYIGMGWCRLCIA
jgi:CRISPR type III-A-associated RAMP protein Csm5